MNKRSVSVIVLVLLFGTFFGTLLGEILAWMLPESVVRDFFLKSIDFSLGGYRGEPLSLDFIMIDVVFINPAASEEIYQDLHKDYSAIEPPTWSLLLAHL